MTDRLLLAEIDVSIRKLEKTMRRAGLSVDGAALKMTKRWDKSNRAMAASSQKASRLISASFAGISIGAALTVGVRTIAEFRQAMSTVEAITQATGAEFEALEAKARDLGATTRFSATEAAEGMIALARAGFDTSEVLASIEGTLQLAQAGALGLGQAADIASNVLQGFRLGAEQSARAVDVLALAANSSNTDVEQLGQALSFVAPASASVGVSLEESAAAISALSDAGIQATRAGTGLRGIFIKLAAAGYDFSEAGGGIAGVLEELSKKNIDLSKAANLVGARQAASLLVLLDSRDKLGELTTAYEGAAGSAARVASVMDDNLNGALLATRSRLQEMQIALGEAGGEQAMIDSLGTLQDILVFVADNATTFNKAIIVLSSTIGGLIGGKVLLGATRALIGFRTNLIAANVATGTATLSLKGLTVATRTFLAALGPIGIIATAAGLLAALAVNTNNAAESFDKFGSTLTDIEGLNTKVEQDTIALKGAYEELAKATREGGLAAVEAKSLEVNAINERLAKNKELIKLKRQILAEQIAAGRESGRGLVKEQAKVASGSVSSRNISEEQAERFNDKLLKITDDKIANGEALTKREKKFRELRLAVLENNVALKEAEERAKALDAILSGEVETVNQVSGKPSASVPVPSTPTTKEPKVDKALESKLAALRQLARTEIEQIKFVQEQRLASIEKLNVAEAERARLVKAVNDDAAKQIKAIEDKRSDADNKAKEEQRELAQDTRENTAEKLALMTEIEAAAARLHGNTLLSVKLEMEAERQRLQAKLLSYDEIERREAQLGLKRLDASERELQNQALQEIDSLTSNGGDDGGLLTELDRIDVAEQAKLAKLKEYQGVELEQLRSFEAIKTQIETEADNARTEAKRAALDAQLATVQGNVATIGAAFKEGSKAQKIAAKVEQAIAISRIAVNTAQGVSSALGSVPFPLNIPAAALVGALGAAQIAAAAAPSFDGGGRTSSGARTGGVDGKGGFNAVLHPNEVVADMTRKGREVNGQSLESVFGLNSVQAPIISPPLRQPQAVSTSITGPSLTIQGNVDRDVMPMLESRLTSMERDFNRNVTKIVKRREKTTQSRTARTDIGRR